VFEGKDRVKIRLAGSGGQGLLLAGLMLGEAAAIYDGREVCVTNSYGPEARGGASKSEVVISSEQIDYPKATNLDVLLTMNQESCDKNYHDLKHDGVLLADEHDVKSVPTSRAFVLAFTDVARDVVGKAVTANVVALGALCALTEVVSRQALKAAVLARAPKGTEELNLKALKEGFAMGEACRARLAGAAPTASGAA